MNGSNMTDASSAPLNVSNLTHSLPGHVESTYSDTFLWFLAFFYSVGIAADCLIIVVIRRTPTLKSYTGSLMVSQTLSDIGLHFVSFSTVVSLLMSTADLLGHNGRIVLAQIGQSFRGIISQTLTAISLNIYFAICHSAAYRNRMSNRHVAIFFSVSWIFNFLLCMAPLIPEETRTSLYIPYRRILLYNHVASTYKAWIIIIINIYVVPVIGTAFSFIQIQRYSQKIQSITNANLHYRQKYKLSQIITGISACYIGIWILLHMFRSLQAMYEIHDEERGIFQILSEVAYMINLVYGVMKLFVYMWIYKPIRDTVLQLFRRNRVVGVETIRVDEANCVQ